MSPEEYQTAIAEALIKVIMETGQDPETGVTLAYADEAVTELLNAMAMLLHTSQETTSPTKTRLLCDELARRLQRKIGMFQKAADAGLLPFVNTLPEVMQ